MRQDKAFFGSFYSNSNKAFRSKTSAQNSHNSNGANNLRAAKQIETTTEKLTWAFQAVPTLYSVYQKVHANFHI